MMSGNNYNKINRYSLLSSLFMLALLFTGCQSPDELLPSVSREGINSITASFADGRGEFVGTPNANKEIIIEVPYYYPVESTDRVTTEMLSKMRVKAHLDDNVTLSPKLLYLDLTQENSLQIINQRKEKHDFMVTAQVVKSKEARLEEFELLDLGLVGVINQTEKTISLVTTDIIEPQLAQIRLSAHATIEPDPREVELDYNSELELKVIAHDGVSSTIYRVVKDAPAKIERGIRPGSEKLLFAKELKKDLGIDVDHLTGGLALSKGNLVLNTRGKNSIYLDGKTGAIKGEIDLGAVKGNLINFYNTSDEAGNILIANLSSPTQPFTLWKLSSVTATPEVFLQWNTSSELGRKVSVIGSLDADAIITAPITTGVSSQFAKWVVRGGNLVSQTPEIVNLAGLSWTTNADLIYSSATDENSDYFAINYSDNTFAWVNGLTNTVSAKLAALNQNFIANAVDLVEFNHVNYASINHVNSFGWGQADQVWLLDVSEQSLFTGDLHLNTVKSVVWQSEIGIYGANNVSPAVVNANGTADVLLAVSEDGYFLYFYFLFTNGYVVGYQFDCMDM